LQIISFDILSFMSASGAFKDVMESLSANKQGAFDVMVRDIISGDKSLSMATVDRMKLTVSLTVATVDRMS
jgi:hypothetical protein